MDHGIDGAGMDPHGIDPHDGIDPAGLEHDGVEPGMDDLGPADHAWPEDHLMGHEDQGVGREDHLDPDLASAETTDLSFAEEYGHHLAADGGHPTHDGDWHDGDWQGGDRQGGGRDGDWQGGGEEPLFGADPDLHPLADPGLGADQPFPPALDLDPPEPIDGYPWTDPAALGHDILPPLDGTRGRPDPAELFEYAGEQPPTGGDAWSALLASEDPATSALARWWSAAG